MKRFVARSVLLGVLLSLASLGWGRGARTGWCEQGGKTVTVPGATGPSTTKFQQTFTGCTVTVYLPGTTTLATIYSTSAGGAQANPFTADSTTGFWQFFADDGTYDVKISGGSIPTPYTRGAMTAFDPSTPGNIRVACSAKYGYPASNFNTVITAAQADLPSTGGVVDARCYQGAQSNTSALTVGTSTKPVELLLGAVTLSTNSLITISNASSIVGLPGGLTDCSQLSPSIIKMTSGANLNPMISVSGRSAAVWSMALDGNKANNSSGGNSLLLAGGFDDVYNVSIINSKGKGVYVAAAANAAAASQIRSSFVCSSDGDGINVFQTGDTFIDNVQSENNEGIGMNLDCAGGTRIHGGDSGGNGHNSGGTLKAGIRIQCKSGASYGGSGVIIDGIQFGNNYGNALEIDGWDSVAGTYNSYSHQIKAYFISPQGSTNTVNAIDITDGANNRIDAQINAIDGSHTYKYGVAYHETSSGRAVGDTLSATLFGIYGTGTILRLTGSPKYDCVNDTVNFNGFCRMGPKLLLENNDYLYWRDSTGVAQPAFGVNSDNSATITGIAAGAGAGDNTLTLQAGPSNVNTVLSATATTFKSAYPVVLETGTHIVYTHESQAGLSNGANNNIPYGGSSLMYVSGPSGAFNITGITAPAEDGTYLVVLNASGHTMTVKTLNGGSSASNQINTLTGADITASIVELVYTGSKWYVISAR